MDEHVGIGDRFKKFDTCVSKAMDDLAEKQRTADDKVTNNTKAIKQASLLTYGLLALVVLPRLISIAVSIVHVNH